VSLLSLVLVLVLAFVLRPRVLVLVLVLDLLSGPPRARAAADDLLDGNADEKELARLVTSDKLIRARELAEKVLASRPDSILARLALVQVFHDEEANLPRALYHAREAEKLLLARYGRPPSDERARQLHLKLLHEEEAILGEMDRRLDQLAVMDRHDADYRPTMDRFRIWPLMKLHRFSEAVALARKVSLSEDLGIRITGLNGMIAIESERLDPRACFRIGAEATEATGFQSCILAQNTAEAAFAVYKFDEAERFAQKSLQASIHDCPASAYPHLANLYLLRADYSRAVQAVQSARGSGIARRYRQQFEMANTSWLVRLLTSLGKFDKAYELAERVIKAPDREGMTSFSTEVMRLVYTVDYHAALAGLLEARRERASVRPLSEKLKSFLESTLLEQRGFSARRRATQVLSVAEEIVHLVRPYFKPLPPWNAGHLIDVAGAGIVEEAVEESRKHETMSKETAPYFDALEAEIALRRGDDARALALASGALPRLSKDEVLLRGRTEAVAGGAARRLGREREAAPHLQRALELFPTALRLLGVAIPARILTDSDPLARAVGKALLGSPRLATDAPSPPFAIRVTRSGKEIRVCLEVAGGRRHACASKDPSEGKTREERVALVADEFHEKVFAPRVDLTQRDINSLDGSAVRGDADDVLRQVIGK
jgi:tetratricopeptide (TPR) repeat protein